MIEHVLKITGVTTTKCSQRVGLKSACVWYVCLYRERLLVQCIRLFAGCWAIL